MEQRNGPLLFLAVSCSLDGEALGCAGGREEGGPGPPAVLVGAGEGPQGRQRVAAQAVELLRGRLQAAAGRGVRLLLCSTRVRHGWTTGVGTVASAERAACSVGSALRPSCSCPWFYPIFVCVLFASRSTICSSLSPAAPRVCGGAVRPAGHHAGGRTGRAGPRPGGGGGRYDTAGERYGGGAGGGAAGRGGGCAGAGAGARGAAGDAAGVWGARRWPGGWWGILGGVRGGWRVGASCQVGGRAGGCWVWAFEVGRADARVKREKPVRWERGPGSGGRSTLLTPCPPFPPCQTPSSPAGPPTCCCASTHAVPFPSLAFQRVPPSPCRMRRPPAGPPTCCCALHLIDTLPLPLSPTVSTPSPPAGPPPCCCAPPTMPHCAPPPAPWPAASPPWHQRWGP